MKLVSEKVEFRRTNEVEGKNGKYFMYTFEDNNSSFQLYCKNALNLKKGDSVKLEFEMRIYNNKPQFNLLGVINE